MVDVATRLGELADKLSLNQADVARVVDTNPRTVARWLRDEAEPRRPTRERLLEFIAVLEQLSAVVQPQAAHDWLFKPNPLLGHEKPADLIRRGEYRRVLGAIDALAEGVFL
ncbi:MAG: antitoxin Xre/MbcA/ParS toxin-binding domain-containing protein [Nitriliruptorales bacterium]